ncbi:MAG: CBS domain-containing protein [Thermoplasmata archaeon]|nr:CBS domain-containing protein [Thermoplasmata archaeon]
MPERWPTARELMTASPITLDHDAPLSEALGLMRGHRIHELPVMRGKQLAGMITFESIARHTNLSLATKVEHLMVLPHLVTESTSLPEVAERLLAAGLRAAPVVGRRSELVGVVSRTDLVRALAKSAVATRFLVEQIASPLTATIRQDDTVDALLGQVRTLEEHPLPVVDRAGKLVGAVGVSDLGRVLWRPMGGGKRDAERHKSGAGHARGMPVSTIMNAPAVTIARGSSAAEAAEKMTEERVSSCFVEEAGLPVGIVSQGDLLGLAVGAAPARGKVPAADVYVQIQGLRGSADPETLAEIDRLLAQGLRRISRHVKPVLLNLHISPHATHRSGNATVQVRLHTDRGIFYASDTEWNLFAGIATLMDELAEQVQHTHAAGRRQRRSELNRKRTNLDENVGDPELEARLRGDAADHE